MKRDSAEPVDSNGRGDGENRERQPVDLVDEVVPCDGWQRFCCLESVLDVVLNLCLESR